MAKDVESKLNKIDTSKRLDKKIDRKYARVAKKKERASSNPSKLQKIEKKFGYNYEAAIKSGATPNESNHWPSLDPNTGMVLKGKKHPSMVRTKKTERVLGNKIIRKGGQMYSVPKKKNR